MNFFCMVQGMIVSITKVQATKSTSETLVDSILWTQQTEESYDDFSAERQQEEQ